MKPFITAVILAAGSATRMQGTDKIMLNVGKKPLIYYTTSAFEAAEEIDEIIVVTRKDLILPIKKALNGFSKLKNVVEGGKNRVGSAYNGFCAVNEQTSVVAVHDGARPLVKPCEIDEVCKIAELCGAAICGSEVVNTVKQLDQNGFVCKTLDRNTLFSVATPQAFSYEIYNTAIKKAIKNPDLFTDDAGMVEAIGVKVKAVLCGRNNIKVTTPEDLKKIELLL